MAGSTQTWRLARLMSTTLAVALMVTSLTIATSASAQTAETEHGTTLRWQGDSDSLTGSAMSRSACDVNGDGRGDTVFGAWTWQKAVYGDVGAAYVVLMLLSRTYLGAHWLTDTLAGMLIGAGVAIIVWAPFAVKLWQERAKPHRFVWARPRASDTLGP